MSDQDSSGSQGRPTKYKSEYDEIAYKLAMLGLIDTEIAEFFEVAESTINLWKLNHPSFSESLNRGKTLANAETAVSLYKRANGYEHDDVHITNYLGKITKTKVIKHYPPDTAAAIFFLKNRTMRQRNAWKDRIDNTHSSPEGGPVEIIKTVIVDPKKKREKEETE